MQADSSGPTALEQNRRVSELEEVLEDYFQNDREGWKRGWKAWARRAREALRKELTDAELAGYAGDLVRAPRD